MVERSCLCSGITVAGGDSELQNNNSLSPHLSSALFTHSCIPPLCFHARRTICGLCIEEADFSLTVLERDVHSAIHPEPSQCINPWMLPGTVSLDCSSRLFLVLKVCGPLTGRGIARVIKIKTDKRGTEGESKNEEHYLACCFVLLSAWFYSSMWVMHVEKCIDLFSIDPCQRWMRYNGNQSIQIVIYWLWLSIILCITRCIDCGAFLLRFCDKQHSRLRVKA